MTYQELINHEGLVTCGNGTLYYIKEVKKTSVVLEAYSGVFEDEWDTYPEYPQSSVYPA